MAKKMKTAKKTSKKPAKKIQKKSPVKKTALKKVAAKKPAAKKMFKPAVVAKATKPPAKATVAKSPKLGSLLTPLDDRLVIQVEESPKMTSGGLHIPDTASVTGNNKGIVLAVGRGHKNKKGRVRPMDVKPGDRVLFDQYAGSKMNLAGAEVRILRESEILGIVE